MYTMEYVKLSDHSWERKLMDRRMRRLEYNIKVEYVSLGRGWLGTVPDGISVAYIGEGGAG
jgi:hypothetical protein